MIEIKHKLKKAMHFVFHNHFALAHLLQHVCKDQTPFALVPGDRIVYHVYDHNIVSQVRFIVHHFRLVHFQLGFLSILHYPHPSLLQLRERLYLRIACELHLLTPFNYFCLLCECLLKRLNVRKLVSYKIVNRL